MSELSRRSFLRAGGLAATAALGLAEGCTNARPKTLSASISTRGRFALDFTSCVANQ